MTETLTKDLKIGDIARRKISGRHKEYFVDFIILTIAPSKPGERDFELKVAAPSSDFFKAPHSYYVFADEEWKKIGEIDVDDYWKKLNEKPPMQLENKGLHDYLDNYNKRCPPLKQLTLAENDMRIQTYKMRDWWGNELTSPDASEHLWNLYQREELPNHKHFYLKMYAKSKGVKLPEYDRDTLGFPLFTEEQIKQLEAIHG